MQKVRAVILPLSLLLALCVLAAQDAQLDAVAEFSFIWDVLLGAALGAGLALLPAMAGLGGRKNVLASLFWAPGFAAMLLIFYQYMTLVTDMRIEEVAFLAAPGTRMRVVEGALLSFCSFVAGRGKA